MSDSQPRKSDLLNTSNIRVASNSPRLSSKYALTKRSDLMSKIQIQAPRSLSVIRGKLNKIANKLLEIPDPDKADGRFLSNLLTFQNPPIGTESYRQETYSPLPYISKSDSKSRLSDLRQHTVISPPIDMSPYFPSSESSDVEGSIMLPEIHKTQAPRRSESKSATIRPLVRFIRKEGKQEGFRNLKHNYGNEYPYQQTPQPFDHSIRNHLKSEFEQCFDMMLQSPRAKDIMQEGLKQLKEKKFLEEATIGSQYSKFVKERLRRKKWKEEQKREEEVQKLSMKLGTGNQILRFREMMHKKYYEYDRGYKLKSSLSKEGQKRLRWLLNNNLSKDSILR